MKKLFNTGSLIEIDEFATLRINGPYTLVLLGPDYATIKSGNYTIETSGEELMVDMLAEEAAVFSFSSISQIKITKVNNGEIFYAE